MQNISAEQVVRVQVSLPQRLKLPNISSRQIGDNTSRLAANHLDVVAIWRLGDRNFSKSALSRSIGGWLHDTVVELLGCHYFLGQWVVSGLFDGFVGRRVIHKVNRWVGVLVTGSLSVFVGGSVCVFFGMTVQIAQDLRGESIAMPACNLVNCYMAMLIYKLLCALTGSDVQTH